MNKFQNREKQRSWNREYQNRKRLKIRSLLNRLKDRPCADCHKQYPPCVMDFDHLDPSIKEKNIGVLSRLCNEKKLLSEINKCEVVCANCHRLRTKLQREAGAFSKKQTICEKLHPKEGE